MRPIEIALAASLVPSIAFFLWPLRSEATWFWLFPIASLVLLLSHLVFEGLRWQMAPLYLLVVLSVAHQAIPFFRNWPAPNAVGLFALACLVSGVLLSSIAPVFRLPTPTGPYNVGTSIRHLVDPNRPDPQADDPGSPRELMIQIWYPAAPSPDGRHAPYRELALTDLRNRRLWLAQTDAVLEAPVAQDKPSYPVVIYSPSWRGQRTENTFLAEELASHGYVVVSMDHTYSTVVTAFPDGRIARSKLIVEEDYSSDQAFGQFIRIAEDEVAKRTQDARFVLDDLHQINANDPGDRLTGHLDLNAVGILGFSFGGTVAAEACWLDHRFRAGVDMDGMLAGELLKYGTSVPILFLMTEDPPDPASIGEVDAATRRESEFEWQQYLQMQNSLSTFGGYWITLPDASHTNFSDAPFLSPFRWRSGAGRGDREALSRSITRYTIAYFDQQLKHKNEDAILAPKAVQPTARRQRS